jgi:UDP-2,3-diacylglucosamine pyrophosphatase LpxH
MTPPATAVPPAAPTIPAVPIAGIEQAALEALAAHPPQTVLVASDLHLSAGRDPATGRFDRIENFFADEAFARFLEHYRPEAAEGALLVLNGDTLDFLRVVATPLSTREIDVWRARLAALGVQMTAAQLDASIDAKERRYGLGTEDFKCVWKMDEIAAGHRQFFDGLAGWLAAGGRMLVVKGNHDVEFHWPLVRLAFRRMLGAAAGGTGPGSVVFCDDFVRLANVHLEHGHQYETPTRVEGPPTVTVEQDGRQVETIRLPSGSFVNRYLINSAEDIYPFLDNARPLKKSIRLILRQHPVKALSLVLPAYHLIRRSWKISPSSFGRSLLVLVNVLAPLVGILVVGVILYFGLLLVAAQSFLAKYGMWLSLLGVALPYLMSAIADWLPKKKGTVMDDEFSDLAYKALAARRPPAARTILYAVYGHTHTMDVQLVPVRDGVPSILYLNTGTWTPLYIDDRPDLIGRTFRPFLRFTLGAGGEYRHQYLQWNDERGVADPIEILGPVRRSGAAGVQVTREPEPAQPAEAGNAAPAVGP